MIQHAGFAAAVTCCRGLPREWGGLVVQRSIGLSPSSGSSRGADSRMPRGTESSQLTPYLEFTRQADRPCLLKPSPASFPRRQREYLPR